MRLPIQRPGFDSTSFSFSTNTTHPYYDEMYLLRHLWSKQAIFGSSILGVLLDPSWTQSTKPLTLFWFRRRSRCTTTMLEPSLDKWGPAFTSDVAQIQLVG